MPVSFSTPGLAGIDAFTEHPGSLVQGSDGNLYGTTEHDDDLWAGYLNDYYLAGSSLLFIEFFVVTTNGDVSTVGTNGAPPFASLTLGGDGNFYGTSAGDGDYGAGTVFRVTPSGALTTLVSFAGTNGANPYAALTQGSDGNFYGTTAGGGRYNYGTVFQVTTNGVLTTLVSFNGTNGANPYAALTLGSDGNFYGTVDSGGYYNWGVIYRLRRGVTIQSFGMKTNGLQISTLNVGHSGWIVLESSSDLVTWRPMQTNGTAAAQQFLDPSALTQPHQFYRVRQQ
jgi:uncharacterized repeat protein (TIGR03803 family)